MVLYWEHEDVLGNGANLDQHSISARGPSTGSRLTSKRPTRPPTYVDVTVHKSTLTNGYESNLTYVYRAAVV